MLDSVPAYLKVSFLLTTALTLWFFYKAGGINRVSGFVLLAWITLQLVLSFSGVYQKVDSMPPPFMAAFAPPLLFMIYLVFVRRESSYIDALDARYLTLLHVIRIPVELILYGLFVYGTIPELMTFAGRNYDILAGITAPLAWYMYRRGHLGRKGLLWWNIVCLGLLLSIVINAILSAPFPFQQFAKDQPNIAVLYFPFTLLPSVVVVLVMFSHMIMIRRLLQPAKALRE